MFSTPSWFLIPSLLARLVPVFLRQGATLMTISSLRSELLPKPETGALLLFSLTDTSKSSYLSESLLVHWMQGLTFAMALNWWYPLWDIELPGSLSEVRIPGLQLSHSDLGRLGWQCAVLTNTQAVQTQMIFTIDWECCYWGSVSSVWEDCSLHTVFLCSSIRPTSKSIALVFTSRILQCLNHQITYLPSLAALYFFCSVSPGGTLSRGIGSEEQINQWSWDLSGPHLHLNGSSILLLSQSFPETV